MRAEAAEGAAMSSTGYARGLLCECGARRSDNSRRLCAQRRYLKAPWEIIRDGLFPGVRWSRDRSATWCLRIHHQEV